MFAIINRAKISVEKKLEIQAHNDSCKTARATAIFEKQQHISKERAEKNSRAYTVQSVRANQVEQLEQSVYDWIVERRHAELAFSIHAIKLKELSLDTSFKNSDQNKLAFWAYLSYKG